MSGENTDTPEPVLIIDTREQTPLVFNRLAAVRRGLQSGDYSVLGYEDRFTVERKTLDDLAQSVTRGRERFTRELARLSVYPFRRWLIVGTQADVAFHRYHSEARPDAVLASVAALEIRYSVPVVWSANAEEAAAMVEAWARYFTREQGKAVEPQGGVGGEPIGGHHRREKYVATGFLDP